ncbi:MAG: HPr kinase/phosphorylase [Acetobacteraceae bacterium]
MLLVGPPGSGKSDLLLRLIDCGFSLVSDDRVEIADGVASAPETIAGLIEVRGLGVIRLPYTRRARLALAVELGANAERLPGPGRHAETGLPMVALDAHAASAPVRVRLALDCVLGYVQQDAGAFAA